MRNKSGENVFYLKCPDCSFHAPYGGDFQPWEDAFRVMNEHVRTEH